MPKDLKHMDMLPSGGEARAALENGEPEGKVGAIPLASVAAAKDGLTKFTDSLHQKASQVVGWINTLEEMNTERSQKLLDLTLEKTNCYGSFKSAFPFLRFVADMNQLLAKLEGSFEKLAECLHLLDEATDDATLGPFLVCFFSCLQLCSFFCNISCKLFSCSHATGSMRRLLKQSKLLVSRTSDDFQYVHLKHRCADPI